MDQFYQHSNDNNPQRNENYIVRQEFHTSLTETMDKKITILRAPAGYGKTTILNAWIYEQIQNVAWVALDNADNDPIRFWRAIVTALSSLTHLNWQQHFTSILQTQDFSTLEFFIDALTDELQEINESIAIVVDDYHVINESKIHELFTLFIESLPSNVNIYVTTRTVLDLPTSQWRMKHWLAEFDLSHFQFSFDETKQYFEQNFRQPIQLKQLQAIHEKCEGWITGITLACFSQLLHENNNPNFILISEILWQEMIHELPEDTQEFLLKTAYLPQLTADVCDQLNSGYNSHDQLEFLQKKGIFTTRIQKEPDVYCYHQLFSEALQNEANKRYSAAQIEDIIQKTIALVYEQQDYITAIELAMELKHYKQAEQWILTHFVQLLLSGQMATFLRWLKQFREANYKLHIEILIIGFMNAISTLQFPLANALMEEIEQRHQSEQWKTKPEFLSLVNLYHRTKAYAVVALGGDIQTVMSLLNSELKEEQNISRWDGLPFSYNFFEPQLLRTSLAVKGKMHSPNESDNIVNFFRYTDFKKFSMSASIFGIAAETFYERDDIERAHYELNETLKYAEKHRDLGLLIPMYILQAKLYIIDSEYELAIQFLNQKIDTIEEKHWKHALQIKLAHCLIESGQLDVAKHQLLQNKSNQPFWILMYVRLLLKNNSPGEALIEIIPLKQRIKQEDQMATLIEVSLLEVVCYYHLGKTEKALDLLHTTFQIGAKYWYVRTFLDEKDLNPILQHYLTNPNYKASWTEQQQAYFQQFQK